jgi:hypothetical protein
MILFWMCMAQQTKNSDINGILYKEVEHIFSWFCKDSELNGSKTFPNVMCFCLRYEYDFDCNKSKIFEPATLSEHTLPQPEIILINIEIE